MKSRKFVLEITETAGVTIGELTRAVSRTAGRIDSGRSALETGSVRDNGGKVIGRYYWEDQSDA